MSLKHFLQNQVYGVWVWGTGSPPHWPQYLSVGSVQVVAQVAHTLFGGPGTGLVVGSMMMGVEWVEVGARSVGLDGVLPEVGLGGCN